MTDQWLLPVGTWVHVTKYEDLLAGVHPSCDVAFERNCLHKRLYYAFAKLKLYIIK